MAEEAKVKTDEIFGYIYQRYPSVESFSRLICKNQDLIVQKEVFSQDLTDTSSTMAKSN